MSDDTRIKMSNSHRKDGKIAKSLEDVIASKPRMEQKSLEFGIHQSRAMGGRPIFHLKTQQRFETVSEASRELNLSSTYIHNRLKNRIKNNNKEFIYLE
jgi:hypothetical protein